MDREVTIPGFRIPRRAPSDREITIPNVFPGASEDLYTETGSLRDDVAERINRALGGLLPQERRGAAIRYFFRCGDAMDGGNPGEIDVLDTPEMYADDDEVSENLPTRVYVRPELPLTRAGEAIEKLQAFTRRNCLPLIFLVGSTIGFAIGNEIGKRVFDGQALPEQTQASTLLPDSAVASLSPIVEPIVEPIAEPIRR